MEQQSDFIPDFPLQKSKLRSLSGVKEQAGGESTDKSIIISNNNSRINVKNVKHQDSKKKMGMGMENEVSSAASRFTYHVLIPKAIYYVLIYNPGKLR